MLTKMMGRVAAGGVTPATSVYTGENFVSNPSDQTYNNAPIGTADSTRIVIVGILIKDRLETAPTSVSIGGSSASQIGTTHTFANGSDDYSISFWGLSVSSGTTATIVATFNTPVDYSIMIVYALYNSTITPTDQDDQAALDLTDQGYLSHSITVQDNGTIITMGQANDASLNADDANYTVLTEDINLFDSGEDTLYIAAHLDFITGADPQAFILRNDYGPTIDIIQSTAMSFPAA